MPGGQNAVSAPINPDLEVDVKSYMLYGYKDFTNNTKFSTNLSTSSCLILCKSNILLIK